MTDIYEGLAKAMEVAERNDNLIVSIYTLAVEYEAKAITAERFADRVLSMLVERFKTAPSAAAQLPEEKK